MITFISIYTTNMSGRKENKRSIDNINERIKEAFKDGRVILDGPISQPNRFWTEVKDFSVDDHEFMKYLKNEREKCTKMSEVSNDPTFWLGKVDAFLEVEKKILSILNEYRNKLK